MGMEMVLMKNCYPKYEQKKEIRFSLQQNLVFAYAIVKVVCLPVVKVMWMLLQSM